MDVDKQTVKIVFFALALALASLWSVIREFGADYSTAQDVIVRVLLRTVVFFAIIRFVLWIFSKKK